MEKENKFYREAVEMKGEIQFDEFYNEYFPFWGKLSDDDRNYICQNSSIVNFDKKQVVHGDDDCSGLFIVRSGKLRLYMLSEDGREITLYRLSPGEICMLSASCVLQTITFDVFVEAEVPSECFMIAPSAFSSVSERMLEVKNYALEVAVQRFSDVMWVMQQIMFMSTDKRLAIFLLDEITSSGSDTVSMTHEQISRHIGTAREVVTRMLKHFALDGLLEVTRKGIKIIDIKKLRDIAY